MAGQWCPDCRAFMADGTTCPECRRRLAWGQIVAALWQCYQEDMSQDRTIPWRRFLDNLAAVAMLMQERQALLHQHRKDMRDEALAAQRASRGSYDQGRDDGRREGRDDW